jgi:hypothetical protein
VRRAGEGAAMMPLLPEAWIPAAWQPPVAAFAIALAMSLVLAFAGRRDLAGAGAAAGLVAALFLVFGVRMVTPRLLPERLPWLVLAAGLGGFVADLIAARGLIAGLLAAATALAGGWFMLGAPRAAPDLARIVAEALPVAAAFAVPLWRLVPLRAGASATAASALSASALLAVGLFVAGSAAAFVGFAAMVAGAAGGLLAVGVMRGAGAGLSGALALAAGLAGVAVSAGLAQRHPAVWAACAAPLVGLAAGVWAAQRLGLAGGRVAAGLGGVMLAGLPAVALAWALRGLG